MWDKTKEHENKTKYSARQNTKHKRQDRRQKTKDKRQKTKGETKDKTRQKARPDQTRQAKERQKDETKDKRLRQEVNPIQLWCQMTRLKHTRQKTRHQDTMGKKRIWWPDLHHSIVLLPSRQNAIGQNLEVPLPNPNPGLYTNSTAGPTLALVFVFVFVYVFVYVYVLPLPLALPWTLMTLSFSLAWYSQILETWEQVAPGLLLSLRWVLSSLSLLYYHHCPDNVMFILPSTFLSSCDVSNAWSLPLLIGSFISYLLLVIYFWFLIG